MPSPRAIHRDILDPDDFTDRDSLISFLVTFCGWPCGKAGSVLGLSARHIRRIVAGTPIWRPSEPGQVRPLTKEEIAMMNRDYRNDPYCSPEERKLASEWVASHTLTTIEDARPRLDGFGRQLVSSWKGNESFR